MSYKNWLGMKEHVGQVRRYTIAEKVDKEVWDLQQQQHKKKETKKSVSLEPFKKMFSKFF